MKLRKVERGEVSGQCKNYGEMNYKLSSKFPIVLMEMHEPRGMKKAGLQTPVHIIVK